MLDLYIVCAGGIHLHTEEVQLQCMSRSPHGEKYPLFHPEWLHLSFFPVCNSTML